MGYAYLKILVMGSIVKEGPSSPFPAFLELFFKLSKRNPLWGRLVGECRNLAYNLAF